MSSPSRSRTRRAALWAVLTFAWLGVLAFAPVAASHAQNAEKKAGAVAGAAPAAPAAQRSMLKWAIDASGPIGLFLVCLSVYFTALVIRLFMEFRMNEAVPPP